jgi:uncharacterized repeat protein (TIGR02543 family)
MKRIVMLLIAAFMFAGCKKEKIYCTVSFDTRGGDTLDSLVIEKDDAVSVPDPVREGYTFTGWYSSPDLSREWINGTTVDEDMTLYASWKIQTRTLTLVTQSDLGESEPKILDYGSVFLLDFVPYRENYEFLGWYTDESCTVPYDDEIPVTEDITVYAGWRELIHIELEVPEFIDQNAYGAPKGCEGAALLMALKMTGHVSGWDYYSFMNTMPYSPDASPYKGFAGSPWKDTDYIDAMMPEPTETWAKQFAEAKDISGCSTDDLVDCLQNGHPVIIWTSIHFMPSQLTYYEWGTYKSNNHVMTLIGYDEKRNEFKIADPAGWNDGIYWVTYQQFVNSWECYRGAVEVW